MVLVDLEKQGLEHFLFSIPVASEPQTLAAKENAEGVDNSSNISRAPLTLPNTVNIICYELWQRQQELTGSKLPDVWLHSKVVLNRTVKDSFEPAERELDRLASRKALDSFLDALKNRLLERGFFESQDGERISGATNLTEDMGLNGGLNTDEDHDRFDEIRGIFLRPTLTEREVGLLYGVLKALTTTTISSTISAGKFDK